MSSPRKKARTENASTYKYLQGFQNFFQSEALKGALPEFGNTPQRCPYGLYAEQMSGTAFTKAKHANLRSWWYRIRPSAHQKKYHKATQSFGCTKLPNIANLEQLRWAPLPMPTKPTNFIEGMVTYCGAGDPAAKGGIRVMLYACNTNMVDCSYCSSDGDMLIVPEHGTLDITTEMGKMEVPSGFIAVVQRGIRFSVNVPATGARGYICEVFDNHFELAPRGVIGANGLANERDFETPVAWYEDRSCTWTCYQKFCDQMFVFEQDHSPYDIVAWHGNYAPFRYDLNKFCVINSVSFDHLDPCTFVVLTAQTGEFGVASCDFAIFPPRWMVQENTFRPPYYHKNIMSEFMGNIRGSYEAKTGGFPPGSASLHSPMAAHGPEVDVFEKASVAKLEPTPPNHDHLAFMFETTYMMKLTDFTANNLIEQDYVQTSYGNFKKHFTPDSR